jgi:predicted Zn-dependent peptidase
MVYYAPKTADTAPALKLGIEMVEDLAAKGITSREFHFAQESLVNRAPFDNDTARKRLENETNEYLFSLEHGFFNNLASNTKNISEGDVAPALAQYFKPKNLAIVVLGDASKLKAELSKLPGLIETKVVDYKAE